MRIKLSKANIQKLEPGATRYEVADVESPAFRLRVTPSGVKTFVLLYRNAENKQKRFTIGKYGDLTPELARDIAQTKMAEIKLGGDPAAQKQEIRRQSERDKYSTLGGFVDLKFGPWAQANRKTGAEMALRIKNQFADYLEKPLDEITPWIIEKWRKAKFERGRKPGTINKDIATLKSCLSRAVDWGVIDHHPLARLKLSKQDRSGVVRYLSPGEEKRLRDGMKARDYKIKQERESGNKWRRDRNKPEVPSLIDAALTDHVSPMVLLSLNTGMRRGEVFNLRWSDVDFSNKSLVIHGHSSKSGRSRHVPLNAEALDTLER
ncbi:MAG: integrase arm-type DNA-binding domain-containing protein, partial [Planctomycetaceae bacterium]|nr:integrase arm-type DNA-binding domain-containing protein [Planctomycetaceae bacterium]